MQDYKDFLAEILFDEEAITKRTAELGAEISADYPEHRDFVSEMRSLIDRFDLDRYMSTLKTLQSHDR